MFIYHESILTKKENLRTTKYGGKIHYKDDQIIEIICNKCSSVKKTRYGWHLRGARWVRNNTKYICSKCNIPAFVAAGSNTVRGSISPLRGKTYEQIHGVKKAKLLRKCIAQKGRKNNQFGRPAYPGSGNGWSGWYRGIYFRSLLELSFIINFIEKKQLKFISAEQRKFCVPYKNCLGVRRNYFADFVIDNILIEVKPKNAINWKDNILKFKAAKRWCKRNNLKYKIYTNEDFNLIDKKQLITMYKAGIIKWLPRYEKKFLAKYYD